MSKESQLTMKYVDKLVTAGKLEEHVGYGFKRGKLIVSFLLREGERKENNEEINVDVSDFNEGRFKILMDQYNIYQNFGIILPEDSKKTEEKETKEVVEQTFEMFMPSTSEITPEISVESEMIDTPEVDTPVEDTGNAILETPDVTADTPKDEKPELETPELEPPEDEKPLISNKRRRGN